MLAAVPTGASDRLATAVGGWLATPSAHAGHDELGERLLVTRALINQLELSFARDAAAFSATADPERDDNPVAWIREQCRMTVSAAVNATRIGEQEGRLARSIEALLAGRIGLSHLGLLAHTAEFAAQRPQPVAFDETALLSKAERLNVARFRDQCYHAEHAMDAAECVASAVLEVEFRRLRLFPGDGGCLSFSGILDAEGGVLLRTALEPLAAQRSADEYRGREQRLADALVELAAHSLDSGAIPQRASQRTHLQVTATLETLSARAGAPAGETDFGGLIPDLTVQRLACDATVTRVLLDAESAVIDVGRSQRVVPGATRRALNVRDRGCRWPGCDRPCSWTAAHHIVHWVHGGRTDMDNLVLLCHRHHWWVHEAGFQIVRVDDGSILTIPPRPGERCQPRAPNA
jgi:hypothetical protein